MFEKITSHLGIYKKILASASILSLLGNSLLYAEVYYPQNGAFIPKKYTMVHGVGTPNQSIDITEKGITLCSTTIGANGEWECPLLSLTDGRHDFIIKEYIIAPGNIELVADVNTGAIGSSPKYFTYANNAIYFSAYNPTYGTELWRAGTDGTGATLVTDIASGAIGSFPNNLMEANDTLYFAANDNLNGQELWSVLDAGSPANLAFDLVAGTGGSNPSFLSNIKDTLYFMAEDSAFGGVNIWNIDAFGFPSLAVSPSFHPLIFLSNHPNGEMYFASKPDGLGYELSWYNTQTRSSYKFNIASGSTDAFPFYGIFAKNDFYFHANDGVHGSEVWKTSVGSTGAVLAADIMTGTGMSSEPRNFTNVNGTLYFTANDGIHGVELWRIKETGEITMVKDIRPGYESSQPRNLTNAYGTLYFTANDGAYGEELWKINKNGEAEIVEDILAGSESSGPSDLLSVHGSLYFTATNSGTLLGKLYKTTPSGGVEQLAPNITIQKKAAHLTYTDYGIYFAGDDGSKGVEPYRIPLDVYSQEMPYTVVVGNIPMDIRLSSPINTGSLITNTFSEKSFPVLIESSEVLGSVSLTGIQVENGSASNLRRIGNNYAFDVTPFTNVNSGTLSVWIGTGAIKDMYDDPFMQASNALNWFMDTDEPHAILLIPENPSKILTGGVLQNGMNIRVYSSERLEDFTLSDISASGANISNLVWNSLGYYSFRMLPKTQSGNIDIFIGTGTVQDLAGNTNLESSNTLHWEINTSPAPQAFITSIHNKDRIVGENLTITGITATGNTTSLVIQGNGNPSTLACTVSSPYYGGSIFECPLPSSIPSGNYKIHTQTCDPYGNCGTGNMLDIEINTNAGNLYTYSRLQHSVNTTTNEHTFTLSVEYGENKGIPMVNSYIDIKLDPNVDFKEAYFITSSGSSRKISFIPSAYANEATAYGEYNPGTHTYHINLGKISAHEHGTITLISELTEGINAKDVMLSFETTLSSNDEIIGTIVEENSEDNIAKSHYLLGENDLMEIYFGKITNLTSSHSRRCSNYEVVTNPSEIITRDIKNHWAGEYIANLTQYGIIGNNPYFSPDKQVTRAEFISMLVRGLSCNYTSEDLEIMSSTFEDIPTNSNISRYVGMAESLGWIKNRTGFFRPNDPISRGESVDMLMTALGELDYTSTEFDDIGQASLFKRAILSAKYLGIINGQYTNGLSLFFPNKELVKSESTKMLSKAFFPSFSGGIVSQIPVITPLPEGTIPINIDNSPISNPNPVVNIDNMRTITLSGSTNIKMGINTTYIVTALKGGKIDSSYSGEINLLSTPLGCAVGGGKRSLGTYNQGIYTFTSIQFTTNGVCSLQVSDTLYGTSTTLQINVSDEVGTDSATGTQSISISSPANNITLPANYGYINGTSSYPGGLVRISVNGTIVANGNANSSGNYSIYVNNLATTNTIQAILIHPTSGAELARSANSTISTR